MNAATVVNESLAIGLRKRLLRETGEDFQAALECLFRRVVPNGCQRAGSTHRRVVAFAKRRFAGRIVRELSAGAGRREVWSCELLLPEEPTDPNHGALSLVRVDIKRRDPYMPAFTDVGVRVSQHAVERVLQRRGDGAWDIDALTTELRLALAICARWQGEHLVDRGVHHWQLPTRSGLAFCAGGRDDGLNVTTWVREHQLRDEQLTARSELLHRASRFDFRGPASVRLVCGPRTPAALSTPH